MQEDNTRLIDEALASEPTKNTFRLGWEFITLNKQFTFIAIGIFTLLNLFGAIPVVSFVFAVFAAVFGVVVQMHAGRTFYGTDNIETYVDEIKKSNIKEVLSRYGQTALGVYLGWLSFLVMIFLFLGFFAATTGMVKEGMSENDVIMALAGLGVPLLVLALVFSYVQPLVHSNIVLANSFQEGFKSVFTVFTKDVWSSALQKSYFSYVSKVGLLGIALLFVVVLAVGLLITVPVIGVFASIFIFVIMYVFMVFMSITSMMARRIVEE
ncbi:MAG: Unknown protein [uncultured Sulfurovum sp.]|uniref:DUF4013 domain-containing protein n=1 Tax=uncultured Sulfurovum sp. TaxID=269237 RepID=A0A6S6SY32_9BACT|nr:MAG: Unknown protein [uncultured Sulfurovum sp.]